MPTSSERLEVRANMYSDLAAELEYWARDAYTEMEVEEWTRAAGKFREESKRLSTLSKKRAKKEKELEHRRKRT